jgi:hypothetical protein
MVDIEVVMAEMAAKAKAKAEGAAMPVRLTPKTPERPKPPAVPVFAEPKGPPLVPMFAEPKDRHLQLQSLCCPSRPHQLPCTTTRRRRKLPRSEQCGKAKR